MSLLDGIIGFWLGKSQKAEPTVFRCHDCDLCYSTPDGEMLELPVGLCPGCSKRIQEHDIEREKFRERGE